MASYWRHCTVVQKKRVFLENRKKHVKFPENPEFRPKKYVF